jgi:RNA polymerase sigma factor (sigma-70 family)
MQRTIPEPVAANTFQATGIFIEMAPVGRNPGVDELLAHAGWLGQLARQLARGDVADDMMQETWVAALRRPPDEGRPPRPWLARVLFNFVRQHGRGETRRSRREDEARAAATTTTEATDDVYQRLEQQRALAGRVMALDEEERRVVLLRFYDGRTSAEIARMLGVPAGTVRWRLKTALDRLRADLDRGPERDRWRAILAPGVVTMAKTKGLLLTGAAAGVIALGSVGVVVSRTDERTNGSGPTARTAVAPAAAQPEAPPPARIGAPPLAPRRRAPASGVATPGRDDPAPRARSARSLYRDEIRAAMEGVLPRVKKCYQTLLEEDPDGGRRVLVKMVIREVDGKGRIVEASIVPRDRDVAGGKTELDAPRTEQCVLDAVAHAEFPPGDATFSYPFRLSPP